MTNFIVFGPTGSIGSVAARTAQSHGAKVFLAMRDPTKPIPNLTREQEEQAGFERIQADLNDPDSISAAVTQTNAKHAFIYVAFAAADHMRASIEALKGAGVTFVVLLSSYSIHNDARDIDPQAHVAYAHAQVELNLAATFGEHGFVAVRPAWFASNTLWWKAMILEGDVGVPYPGARYDWISPNDIGRVCGVLLAEGPRDENVVRMCGPALRSEQEAITLIGKALGRDIKVRLVDEQTGFDLLLKSSGNPEHIVKSVLEIMSLRSKDEDGMYHGQKYETALGAVLKYTGKQPETLERWVELNKATFTAK